jgi:hypothetical protein
MLFRTKHHLNLWKLGEFLLLVLKNFKTNDNKFAFQATYQCSLCLPSVHVICIELEVGLNKVAEKLVFGIVA